MDRISESNPVASGTDLLRPVWMPVAVAGIPLCAVWWFGLSPDSFRILCMGLLLGVAALTDLRQGIIPNLLIATGMAVAALSYLSDMASPEYLVAGVLALGIGLGIRFIGQQYFGQKGLGMGDIKLFFVIGLLSGWQVLWIIYLAVLLGGAFALAAVASGRLQRDGRLVFAPFIFTAFLLEWAVQPSLIILKWWGI